MNTTDFTYVLQHPEALNTGQITDVKSVIQEFPYFQSARAIYLKGLKNQDSYKYNQALKTTAAYTTDRSVLFDFITSKAFLQNKISEYIKQNTEHIKSIELSDIEDISIQKSVIIDDALKQQIKDSEPILDPELFEAKVQPKPNKQNILEVDGSNILKTPEEKLEIGKPFSFSENEAHSFGEWLKITSFKPIIREEPEVETEPPAKEIQTKKLDLIDKFIASKPKIKPIKKDATIHNIAKAQMIQPEALMTETLARIYVEQKNYNKAIQSYKILSLKYPEKSGFFADQIQAVKELQEQNNIL